MSTEVRQFLIPVLIRRGQQAGSFLAKLLDSLAALSPEHGNPYHET